SAATMGAHDLIEAERAFVQSADTVIAVSNFAASDLAAAYGITPPVVVPNGVDRALFTPGPVTGPRSGYRVTLDNQGHVATRQAPAASHRTRHRPRTTRRRRRLHLHQRRRPHRPDHRSPQGTSPPARALRLGSQRAHQSQPLPRGFGATTMRILLVGPRQNGGSLPPYLDVLTAALRRHGARVHRLGSTSLPFDTTR